MEAVWKRVVIFVICSPLLAASISMDSLYLDLLHRNVNDLQSFDSFYRGLLRDVRQHRLTDTVSTPVNVEKLQSNTYSKDYLKNSCYETASDLLGAHGYGRADLNLSINDLQSLLPAVLYSIENPGCERRLPPVKQYPFFDIWIFGLVFIVIMKVVHWIIFLVTGDHSSVLTASGLARSLSSQTNTVPSVNEEIRFAPVKYHLWLGLGFNAFTCGLILGTISYHLIPHIYETPNEDFSYTYLFRGTVILCGVFLFFIVEKLLRFRFKVDEKQFDQPVRVTDEEAESADVPMMQMAKMHGTFHVHERDHIHHTPSDPPVQSSSNGDSAGEEIGVHVHDGHGKSEKRSPDHHKHQTRNLLLYHTIYDFSNDVIYGCGLSTALAHDRLIGFVLCVLIFSEGFRRHSYLQSSLGRKLGFAFLFFSVVFLIFGYVIGGILTGMNQQFSPTSPYIPKEYIYSVVYGALFYTALVTLIPELNDFGQHLQASAPTSNQSPKQQRLLKLFIFICQSLFLLIGVLIALVFAIIWRFYHRRHIYAYVCPRDPARLICRF